MAHESVGFFNQCANGAEFFGLSHRWQGGFHPMREYKELLSISRSSHQYCGEEQSPRNCDSAAWGSRSCERRYWNHASCGGARLYDLCFAWTYDTCAMGRHWIQCNPNRTYNFPARNLASWLRTDRIECNGLDSIRAGS